MLLPIEKFFHRTDGWSACGLRGLLRLMYTAGAAGDKKYTHHGWIDSDVILDPQCVRRHLFRFADRQLLMTVPAGMLFEQFKLLHTSVDVVAAYKQLMCLPFGGMPLEAGLVYRLRGLPDVTRDHLSPSAIAVHWAYTDEKEEGAEYRKHVILGSDWALRDITTNERLLLFVADTQVKYIPAEHMTLFFHTTAAIVRRAYGSLSAV